MGRHAQVTEYREATNECQAAKLGRRVLICKVVTRHVLRPSGETSVLPGKTLDLTAVQSL
jgi:hypothetical protein